MERLKVVISWKHPRGYVEEVIREDGTRWIVEGACHQCGKCCTIVPLVYRAPGVTVCPKLKHENNKAVCTVQWNRPMGCLLWPMPDQDLEEGCGYRWRVASG